MSAGITFWCDTRYREGDCPGQVSTSTTDQERAERAARNAGWSIRHGRHLCRNCTGDGRR